MNRGRIDQLFTEYERAFSALDVKKSAEFFADTFISAGPKGTIAQSREDFLKRADEAARFYKRVGQTGAHIVSKTYSEISEQYTLVAVHWLATFQKLPEPVEFDVSYIVDETQREPRIVMFISHQDEEEAMQRLGLLQ